VGSFRKLSHHPAAYLRINIPARAGIDAGSGTDYWGPSYRRRLDKHRVDGRGHLLDAPRMAAAALGTVGRVAYGNASWVLWIQRERGDPDVLESELLGGGDSGDWGSLNLRRLTADHSAARRTRCIADGTRPSSPGE
jgi:hypothetical protein